MKWRLLIVVALLPTVRCHWVERQLCPPKVFGTSHIETARTIDAEGNRIGETERPKFSSMPAL
jgi:hypothetical protein